MKMIGTQRSSQFTVPKWLKWVLLIFGSLLIIGIGLLTWMYFHIENTRTSQYDEVSEFVLGEGLLESVDKVTRYNGETPIHIVNGMDDQNEERYLFIDFVNQEEVSTISAADMIDENSARRNVNQCNGCEFVDVQLAFEENRPVWEVTYKDESNRYVFEYLDVRNGEEVQRFAFRQT
ncbi:cell wall elongation regulator TseB-like domain-containing protein [Halobacillus sp. B23F22_1]|uniref:cell wall elongation regulator TseB-like domain-containing protein n=1 Tax=Halobacillus sp. B23F22_1 TaxID=3459514 RepID=UPI00373ED10B